MRILSVVGARPQFIKAAPVSAALERSGLDEYMVHTGQHYDDNMSSVFFDELAIRPPDLNLHAGSGSHASQTAAMLIGLEQAILDIGPDWVLVYGDTNSTLAGAIAAVKLDVPVAHIESGLRSFNWSMPEEHNRIVTDHCSSLLLCPTQLAHDRLGVEGLGDRSRLVGDTMLDAVLRFSPVAAEKSDVLQRLGVNSCDYVLVTVHRPYNTDDPTRLRLILRHLSALPYEVVFPVHPRTKTKIQTVLTEEPIGENVKLVEPLGYLDMLQICANAKVIVTDSGGLQKEAFFLRVPCVTMRPETEWTETVDAGWNRLFDPTESSLSSVVELAVDPGTESGEPFGTGSASTQIADLLSSIDPVDLRSASS